MANNRMTLVNTRTGQRVPLAEYFPSCGWAVVNPDFGEQLDAAFSTAQTTDLPLPGVSRMEGGNEWVVEYEEIDPSIEENATEHDVPIRD